YCGLVGGDLVTAPNPTAGAHRGGFGDTDELERQVPVRPNGSPGPAACFSKAFACDADLEDVRALPGHPFNPERKIGHGSAVSARARVRDRHEANPIRSHALGGLDSD